MEEARLIYDDEKELFWYDDEDLVRRDDDIPHPCPVCGKFEFDYFDSFDKCPICGWVDDRIMTEVYPDKGGGALHMSLNEAKDAYAKGKKIK